MCCFFIKQTTAHEVRIRDGSSDVCLPISGVAPGAKVAAYKACYDGPDPLDNTDDICALSDLLGAINAAIDDGVDVINYSIGGGAATTTLATEDRALDRKSTRLNSSH